jgi:hypothetical protein
VAAVRVIDAADDHRAFVIPVVGLRRQRGGAALDIFAADVRAVLKQTTRA